METKKKENNLFQRAKSNIYLVVYDKYQKDYYTYYYDTEFEKDKAKRRFYFNNRYIIDYDSTSVYWED